MTEAEWLALHALGNVCPLSWLRSTPNERRIFLFLDAYLPVFMFDTFCPACKQLLPLFTQQAEYGLTADEWRDARNSEHHEGNCATKTVFGCAQNYVRGIIAPGEFWNCLWGLRDEMIWRAKQSSREGHRDWLKRYRAERDHVDREGLRLLKDISGNPFQPATLLPSWRTDTALALARQMYESRDFSTMPVLADALQDAGCDNAEVLGHCRDPQGLHVRGYWVVDAVLGR
ncbi:hypothetical protein R5W23_001821 [Gemmata sp. JC673]|uniref:Uncharacterized protein n=1 Tax=Gemmata algarum TaxID=2975278 RepID=A0ABU5F166_9BACT|nr:hypothetical protein [Gemmata algarum]MDY3560577.1 hypothetical protein [Gemmata algarum]